MFLQKKNRVRQKTEAKRAGAAPNSEATGSRTSRDFGIVDEGVAIWRVVKGGKKWLDDSKPKQVFPKLKNASPYIASDFYNKFVAVNGLIDIYINAQTAIEGGNAKFYVISKFFVDVEQHLHFCHHILGIDEYMKLRHELDNFSPDAKMVVNNYFLNYVYNIRKITYYVNAYASVKNDHLDNQTQVLIDAAVDGVVDAINALTDLDIKTAETIV